jgi:crotonobetainyl-CoA:carnitine CoA-transferase CaiB-like acyl-CoA transferase
MAGHGLLLNYEGEDEPLPGGTYADPVAAIVGAFTIGAALLSRLRTGAGQYIEVSLAEVLTGLLPEPLIDYTLNGRIAGPLGNRNPDAAPWSVYRCAGEDDWAAICCRDDGDFLALCAVLDRSDLLADPRFATLSARLQNAGELDAIVSAWTRDRDKHAVAEALQSAGVPAEAAQTMPEALVDRQLQARGFFARVDHPEAGTHSYPLQPSHLSRTPPRDYRAAPTYGQHNLEVLGDLLGLTAEELDSLGADDVIGTEPWEDEDRARKAKSARPELL